MPNLYRCQKCGCNFESEALYPSTYRVLCSDCEPSRGKSLEDKSKVKSILAKEINPNWVYGFVGVTMFSCVATMGMLFFMQSPENRRLEADMRADQQRNEQFKSLARASSVKETSQWEKGSRVKINAGYICKTSEECTRVAKALVDQDEDVIDGLQLLNRVKFVEKKMATIVDAGWTQTQVECDGFVGWIGTEYIVDE